MKKIILSAIVLILFGFITVPAHAESGTFSDNFDISDDMMGWNIITGTWNEVDGKLIQIPFAENAIALYDAIKMNTQTISVDTDRSGGPSVNEGVVFWFKDSNNWVSVTLGGNGVVINENINGVIASTPYGSVPSGGFVNTLSVSADSISGIISVYVDNTNVNPEVLYTAMTSNRVGQSGVIISGELGSFDNFYLNGELSVETPTNKAQCKNHGWKTFTNPPYKNQGECVSSLRPNR